MDKIRQQLNFQIDYEEISYIQSENRNLKDVLEGTRQQL